MGNRGGSRVRRRPVAEELLLGEGRRWDHEDAFEVRASEWDRRSAEPWVRHALEQAPRAVIWTARVAQCDPLRMRLAPGSGPDHTVGWRIRTSRPDVVHLEAHSPLLRGAVVGRRAGPTRLVVSTCVSYDRPRLARAAWAVVAPVRRKVARYRLGCAAGA